MKHTHNIKMRASLWATLGVACLAAAPAMADCQSYWTAAYKCAQGCGPCGGGSGNPGYDDGAARRAQEAAEAAAAAVRQAEADRIERERLAEEKRRKDAAFVRDRDAAANTLKGSTGTGNSQLKGISGTDNYGLKGSGTDAGAQLKSIERHSRDAQLQDKETSRETARQGFDIPGRASGNLVYPDKNKHEHRQAPPSALDRQVPAAARNDPQIQQSLAWYRSLDAQKAEATRKIATIREQQKKGSGDAAVLAAQLGTLTNQSKRIDNDQAKVAETVKKQVKNLGFNLVESPAPTTTEANKK